LNNTTADGGDSSLYPDDLFTRKELKAGGPIVLYAAGMLYMFVFLAIVCDEVCAPHVKLTCRELPLSVAV
jgi:hypothetical protein